MTTLSGLIPAAGKGTRAYPYTRAIPKGMLPIHGRPNIEHLIRIMRDQLRIRDVYIVVGHLGGAIRDHFHDGAALGVNITYLENRSIEKGWAHSILLGKEHIRDHFCVMLSDECYVGTNHGDLLDFPYREALATCAVTPVSDLRRIRSNYAVQVEDGRITRLKENPDKPANNLLGLGTFVLSPEIFDHIEAAFHRWDGREVDLIRVLDALCRKGGTVRPFALSGRYVNINDRDSLQLAKYHVRRTNADRISTSLFVYAESDEPNLAFAVGEYLKDQRLDRVCVLEPDAARIGADLRRHPRLRVIPCPEPLSLYGEKILHALDHMPGDVLVLTEGSYSFHRRDLGKLNAYILEADMVIGTRTTRQLIEQGSNMRGVVRLANLFLAKFLELLWWRTDCRLSDVGCTFRAVWLSSLARIRGQLKARGPEFSVEMIIELLRANERIIEVPVSYYGRSHLMYEKYRNVGTFWRMLRAIVGSRLRRSR